MLNLKKHNEKGFLITFCGLDGAGKTTLIHELCKHLKKMNKNPTVTKQPTSFVRKTEIFRTFMDSKDNSQFDYRSLSLLAASDRLQHANKFILPLLRLGDMVISDRYFYSCLANLRARGLTNDKWIYEVASYIPEPDLAFFVDISVEKSISRIRTRDDEKDRFIDVDLQHKLRREYIELAQKNNGIIIDAEKPLNDCVSEMVSLIDEKFKV